MTPALLRIVLAGAASVAAACFGATPARTAPRAEPPGVAHAACATERPVEPPLLFRRGIPIVPLTVNGAPLDLVLDTGAEMTVLSEAAARRLDLAVEHAYPRAMRSVGGDFPIGQASLRGLAIGGMRLPDGPVLVGPLRLEPFGDAPPDGLLGADILGAFDLDLDLPRGRVVLHPSGAACPVPGPAWAPASAAIPASRSLNAHLMFPIRLGGREIRAFVDTGAERSLLDATSPAAEAIVAAAAPLSGETRLRGVPATTVPARAYRIARLSAGRETLADFPILVAAIGMRDADAILGLDFLRLRRVWLSFGGEVVFVGR